MINKKAESTLKSDETFIHKKLLTYRLKPDDAPMVRIGTIDVQDAVAPSNFLSTPTEEVIDMGLKGHLAI